MHGCQNCDQNRKILCFFDFTHPFWSKSIAESKNVQNHGRITSESHKYIKPLDFGRFHMIMGIISLVNFYMFLRPDLLKNKGNHILYSFHTQQPLKHYNMMGITSIQSQP